MHTTCLLLRTVVTKDKHVMFLTSQKKAIFLSPLKVGLDGMCMI